MLPLAYANDSQWRNRSEFLKGTDAVTAFLTRKWASDMEYRLIKGLGAFTGNRVAVRFAYEYRDVFGSMATILIGASISLGDRPTSG